MFFLFNNTSLPKFINKFCHGEGYYGVVDVGNILYRELYI